MENLGGWTVNTDYHQTYSQEDIDRFTKAKEGLLGVNYEPVEVIATQVVSGTNYAYLAFGSTVTAEPENDYYVVVVYQPLEGDPKIVSIEKIDILDIRTKESTDSKPVTGGWEITDTGKPGMLPGENTQSTFEEAVKSLENERMNPIALLGKQIVAGEKYCALCRAKTDEGVKLRVITWVDGADGTVSLLESGEFDLTHYINIKG